MSDVAIKARENGPFLVTGTIQLTDHLGNVFDTSGQATIALCRYGASHKKPFCDGSHRTCGFQAAEVAPTAPAS
jgi:CDGSH-type Zn-finger protein